jgi:type IV pilus assembly protein PilA
MGQPPPPYPPQGSYPPPGPYPQQGAYPYPGQGGPPPGWQPGGPPPRKGGSGGWLVAIFAILGGVVIFGGILVVLALAGVRKYIANAKTAEARNSLAVLGRDAVMAYEREHEGPSGKSVHRLCPSASRPVPSSILSVSAKKYASSAADWQADASRHAGFACLGFSMTMPQYYLYSYRSRGTNSAGDGFEATAQGDLNGDGKTSLFKTVGVVAPGDVLTVSPQLIEQDPSE